VPFRRQRNTRLSMVTSSGAARVTPTLDVK
jgi:hypothetical protein